MAENLSPKEDWDKVVDVVDQLEELLLNEYQRDRSHPHFMDLVENRIHDLIPRVKRLASTVAQKLTDPERSEQPRMTEIQASKLAIEVQDASNSRGVARLLVRLVDRACEDAKCSDGAAGDPAVYLVMDKLASLGLYEQSLGGAFPEHYASCKAHVAAALEAAGVEVP